VDYGTAYLTLLAQEARILELWLRQSTKQPR